MHYFWLIFVLCFGSSAFAENNLVRLAVVNTPEKSGLMDYLLEGFETESGYRVSVYHGEDVFEQARRGQADLVIAHFGKKPMQAFVEDGFGSWPQMVFANQQALIGPADDPAAIMGMGSASAALKRIAEKGQPFMVNNISGVMHLFDLLWHQAGEPEKQGWLLDKGLAKGPALQSADVTQAYTLWGAVPFLEFQQRHQPALKILVSQDPVLQRLMAITRVNADKLSGINDTGASALQDYLLKTEVQARISRFRQPGFDGQLWWPAARHN